MEENNLLVTPEQINNAYKINEDIKIIENWYDISLINDDNIMMLLGIILGILMLLAAFNFIENLVKIGDKLND